MQARRPAQDRLAEQRAILDTLVEANAEHQARIAMDAPVLQATAQLLADTEVALQEAPEDYDRAAPATAPAFRPKRRLRCDENGACNGADDAAAGPPEATRTDRRDRDRDPPRDRSRSRERRDRRRRG